MSAPIVMQLREESRYAIPLHKLPLANLSWKVKKHAYQYIRTLQTYLSLESNMIVFHFPSDSAHSARTTMKTKQCVFSTALGSSPELHAGDLREANHQLCQERHRKYLIFKTKQNKKKKEKRRNKNHSKHASKNGFICISSKDHLVQHPCSVNGQKKCSQKSPRTGQVHSGNFPKYS